MGLTISQVRKVYEEFNDAHAKAVEAGMEEKAIISELDVYNDIVQNFFYLNRATIKGIYDAIRTGSLPYNKIFCKDVPKIAFHYNDYLNGMIMFVKKFTDIKESDELSKEKLDEMLSKVADKDKRFIEDLFIGVFHSADEDIDCECNLSDAMRNVEYLLDLCKFFDEVKDTVTDIHAQIDEMPESYREYAIRALKLYIASVRFYILNLLETIANCYNAITGSAQHRTPVSGEKETPKFQVF